MQSVDVDSSFNNNNHHNISNSKVLLDYNTLPDSHQNQIFTQNDSK